MQEYIDRVGAPSEMTLEDLNITIAAVERVAQPFHDWYQDAPEGSEIEAYLIERIADMGAYLVELYRERNRRLGREEDNPC